MREIWMEVYVFKFEAESMLYYVSNKMWLSVVHVSEESEEVLHNTC